MIDCLTVITHDINSHLRFIHQSSGKVVRTILWEAHGCIESSISSCSFLQGQGYKNYDYLQLISNIVDISHESSQNGKNELVPSLDGTEFKSVKNFPLEINTVELGL